MSIRYKVVENFGLDDPYFNKAMQLDGHIFGAGHPDVVRSECEFHDRLMMVVAMHGEQLVGYKLGYGNRPKRFYSWLGGVHEEFRGQGIGKQLMVEQHQWLQQFGYERVQTRTKNKWRDMLILNLKMGFEVVGCLQDKRGDIKIVLEKTFE